MKIIAAAALAFGRDLRPGGVWLHPYPAGDRDAHSDTGSANAHADADRNAASADAETSEPDHRTSTGAGSADHRPLGRRVRLLRRR